jgi:hypothetical protein
MKEKDTISFYEPAALRTLADSITYLLIMSRCMVGPAGADFSGGMGYSSQSDPNTTIDSRFTFGLWDNRNGQLISWGRVEAKGKPQRVINKNTWFSLVDAMAEGLLRDAPYKKLETNAK